LTESDRAERWRSEADFFDREADPAIRTLRQTDERTLRRYRDLRRRRFSKEYRLRLLGDLRGKRVLDLGCGDGTNAVILAKQGAIVTGLDISPGAIAVAKERARLDGVSSTTTFVCAPLETVDFVAGSFDVIWCDAILHHLLHDLDTVLDKLRTWLRRGGRVICSEPVNRSPLLRRTRLMLPILVTSPLMSGR